MMIPNAGRVRTRIEYGELERMVGYQLHMVDLIALQGAREALAGRDTTPAAVTAMLLIHDNPGCDQATVGRLLSINRSSSAKFIDKLERKGLVKRSEGHDRRSNGLHLTQAGERHLLEGVSLLKKANAALCEPLNAQEQTELVRLLGKLLGNVRPPQAAASRPAVVRTLKPERNSR
jgi:DNA-binding MarR family transcriptional regulator